MITNKGKEQQLKLIAGEAPVFADTFLVGASDKAIDETAKDLDLGWGSFPVSDTVIDYANNQVLFYGTIPAELAGEIREIGLSTSQGAIQNTVSQTAMSFFFGSNEMWLPKDEEDLEFVFEDSKLGAQNLNWNSAMNGQKILFFEHNGINFSGIDKVKIKVNADKASVIKLYLVTSDDAHMSKAINLVNGDNIVDIDIDSMTKTGAYDIGMVRGIVLESNTDNVTFKLDSLVFRDSTIGGLLAREVISPVTKRAGSSMEIEMMVAI